MVLSIRDVHTGGGVNKIYPETIDGVKEDKDIEAKRY